MSKIKFELDMDDVFHWDGGYDENGATGLNFDSWIKDEVAGQINSKINSAIDKVINDKVTEIINSQIPAVEEKINDKLNKLMEEFFNTPYDVRDRYGDIQRKNITVKMLLKENCDNFMNQKVDKRNGEPTSYNGISRINYMVEKTWANDFKYEVDKAMRVIVDELKTKLKTEVSAQIGSKMADIIGINTLLKTEN